MDENIKNLYTSQNFKTYDSMGDIYCLFYEKGVTLLRQNGTLCYISSNKWMQVGYGELLRDYFVKETNPIQLIDLGPNVFESATVDTNILFLTKSIYNKETLSCTMKDHSLNIIDYVEKNSIPICFDKSAWAILNPIEQSIKEKIEKYGTPLKDWDISINYGIKTGCNEAFIIDGTTKDRLIKEDPKSAEIIRPILRGRDIKRYSYTFADKWLLATFPSKKYDIDKYKAIKKYLLNFGYDKLKQTGEKGARKKTNNKWFETQDTIKYWDDFSKQKIVWAELARTGNSFVYDKKKMYTLAGVFILTISETLLKDMSYECLVSFLNCPITLFYFDLIYSKLDNTGWQWKKEPIEKIPIPKFDNDTKNNILKLQNKLELTTKKEERELIIAKISIEIYRWYKLSKDEIKAIYNRTIVFSNEFEIIKQII